MTTHAIPHKMSCPHREQAEIKARLILLAGPESTLFECCDACVPEMETIVTETVQHTMGVSLDACIAYGFAIRVPEFERHPLA